MADKNSALGPLMLQSPLRWVLLSIKPFKINTIMLKYCSAPWEHVTVHPNGDISFCQCEPWTNLGRIGNLFEESLDVIFTNAKSEALRTSIIDQGFKFCNRDSCGFIWDLEEVQNFDHIQPVKLPTVILFQGLTFSCNLQCPQCRSELNYSQEANPTTVKILDMLLDAYKDHSGAVTFSADGNGEFFTNDAYLDFFNSSRFTERMFIEIYTNGTLLNKHLDLLKRKAKNIAGLSVSLDAATSDTYRKIRGHDFSQVISGVENAINLGIDVRTVMVVQQKNYHEILDFQKLCIDLNVERYDLVGVTKWISQTPNWFDDNKLKDNTNVDSSLLMSQLNGFNGFISGNLLTLMDEFKNKLKN